MKELYHTVSIRFDNQEDLEEFCHLIGQPKFILPTKKPKKMLFTRPTDTEEHSLFDFFEEDKTHG